MPTLAALKHSETAQEIIAQNGRGTVTQTNADYISVFFEEINGNKCERNALSETDTGLMPFGLFYIWFKLWEK